MPQGLKRCTLAAFGDDVEAERDGAGGELVRAGVEASADFLGVVAERVFEKLGRSDQRGPGFEEPRLDVTQACRSPTVRWRVKMLGRARRMRARSE